MAKPKLFDFVNEINSGKTNLIAVEPELRSSYNAFMVNRALSQHPETIVPAQIMNYYHGLDTDIQMEYLIQSIPRKKRFSKWAKEEKDQYLQSVIDFYQVSRLKAVEIIDILDSDQLHDIHRMVTDLGGIER